MVGVDEKARAVVDWFGGGEVKWQANDATREDASVGERSVFEIVLVASRERIVFMDIKI